MMAMIIDAVIILLLAGSVTYGYLVSRKVRLLMATLKELEPLVEQFSTAVDRSQYSVEKMRENIEDAEHLPSQMAEHQMAHPASETREHTQTLQRDLPGMRVMRDKKDLVRAFFHSADTARA